MRAFVSIVIAIVLFWEVGFVESISSQVIDRGRSLTERQREFAEKIFDEKA